MSLNVTQPETNLRSNLVKNKQRYGNTGKQILESNTVADARNIFNVDRKNILINGAFDIWQRGTSFPNQTTNAWTADRWRFQTLVDISVDKVSVTGVPGFSNGIRLTKNVTTNDTFPRLTQRIENPGQLFGKRWTFGFYIRGSKPMEFHSGQFHLSTDSADPDGTLVPMQPEKEVGTDWMYFTVTTDILPDNRTVPLGPNAFVIAYIYPRNAGELDAGDWYEITGFQIEEGVQATEFEQRPIGTEITLCQRYYQKSYDLETAPGTISANSAIYEPPTRNIAANTVGTRFLTTMRTTPTVVLYAPDTGTVGSIINNGDKVATTSFVNDSGISSVNITSGDLANWAYYHYTADAEI